MGVQVYVETNQGQKYDAFYCFTSDSKHFAGILLNRHFWDVIEQIFDVPTSTITDIIPGEAVPDELTDRFTSWEAYYRSKFQPIAPLKQALEAAIAFIERNDDWLDRLHNEWEQDDELRSYQYDYHFQTGYFLLDLKDMLSLLQECERKQASEVCISLM